MTTADQQEETKPEEMHPDKKVVLDHLVSIYRVTRSVTGINADQHDSLKGSAMAIEKFIHDNFTEPEKESAPDDAS